MDLTVVIKPLAIILILFALKKIKKFFWVINTPRRNEERDFGKVKLWINEKGYQLPPRIGRGWDLAIIAGLCFVWIPGIVIFFIAQHKRNIYYQELKTFKNKWIEAGSPEGLNKK